jgi:hypothetical protein
MSKKKINYALRPAKNIERKMICEVIRRFSEFKLLEEYRYIGFGSYYFADFSLFHKNLNISLMHSIEQDGKNRDRFETNQPFKCIKIHFGASNHILPNIGWAEESIIWLDYDGDLDKSVLEDIQTVCTHAKVGSVLIITVNAEAGEVPDKNSSRLQKLKDRIGEAKVPSRIREKDLSQWGTAKVLRDIIHNEIQEILVDRNGGIYNDSEKMLYRQLFNFNYSDNAKMLTVGGAIYQRNQQTQIDKCAFERIPFVKSDDKPYSIEIPCLTYRELRTLDKLLPADPNCVPSLKGVPEKDIKIYSEVYRYFPNFAEAEL